MEFNGQELPKCPGISITTASLGQIRHRICCARHGKVFQTANMQQDVKIPFFIIGKFYQQLWKPLTRLLESLCFQKLGFIAWAQTALAAQELQFCFSVLKYFTMVLHNHTKVFIRKRAVLCTLQILDTRSTPSAPVPINAVQDHKGKPSHSGSCTFPLHLLGKITSAG